MDKRKITMDSWYCITTKNRGLFFGFDSRRCWPALVFALASGVLAPPQAFAADASAENLGWHANNDVELSLAGTHLFDPEHPEIGTPATRSEISRGVYGKMLWRC
jgi:hypothetical protein